MIRDVEDIQNKKTGEIDLPEKVFGAKWNPDLVHQVVQAQLSNSRKPWAHAKGRGEVRGGGRKPWKQKGTGRSRQGSIRSPLWKGGGVTFGPNRERNYEKKVNKKMKRLALFSVLSRKLSDGEIKIIDNLDEGAVKLIRKDSGKKTPKLLLIPAFNHKNVQKIVANAERIGAISPQSLNVYDLLKYKNIFLEKEAVGEVIGNFLKKEQI